MILRCGNNAGVVTLVLYDKDILDVLRIVSQFGIPDWDIMSFCEDRGRFSVLTPEP